MKKIFLVLFSSIILLSCEDPISEPITLGYADLELSILVDNEAPYVGDTIRFTVTLKNSGYDDATNVQVKLNLQNGLLFAGNGMTNGTYSDVSKIWSIDRLYRNTTEVLLIDAVLNPAGFYTFSTEVVSAAPQDTDSIPNNGVEAEDDYAQITVGPIEPADLSFIANVSNASPIAGEEITFMCNVQNSGPNDAVGIRTLMSIPSGYTYVSDTSSATYNATTGSWYVGDVLNGDTTSFEMVVMVNPNGDYNLGGEITVAFPRDTDSTPDNNDVIEDDQFLIDTVIPILNLVDDAIDTTAGTAIVIPVYSNDTHLPTEGTLNTSTPTNGAVVVTDPNTTPTNPSDAVFTYTPNVGFVGTDAFTYTICDTVGHCSTATVVVTVN